MKRLVLASALLLGTAHADNLPLPADARIEAFVLSFGGPSASVPMGDALDIHEDGSITVDWKRLRAYAALYPVDRAHWPIGSCSERDSAQWVSCAIDTQRREDDMRVALMVHALLALHDGRVTEVRP